MDNGGNMLVAGRICYSFARLFCMTFEEYLASKKIDGVAFQAAEPDRWAEWKKLFEHVSPASFTSQKLYLINPVRRKYTLKVPTPPPASEPANPTPDSPVQSLPTSPPKPAAKPVFKPKIK